MLGFRVLQPGLLSTFQDKGRLGYQSEGMPISGAMDQESMILANKLVGKEDGAVLEMTFLGASLVFEKSMGIAITGADMQPMLNQKKVSMYQTLFVHKGDVLSFKGLIDGFRSYIAFSDALDIDEVYESKGTYLKIGSGGYKGRKLIKDDEVNVVENPLPVYGQIIKPHRGDEIRVLLGYEHHRFKDASKLFEQTYSVTNDLDRMGMRLEGGPLEHIDGADIISSPIIPGTIQVPKSGQPMIMLRDAQTIGGYTRIGAVISCDLDILAQKKPGDEIRLKPITLEEAVQIKRNWIEDIKNISTHDDRRRFSVTVNGISYDVFVEEK